MNIFKTLGFRAGIVSTVLFVVFIAVWYAATASPASTGGNVSGMTAEQIEYQKMMGKDPGAGKASGFPTPV
ncbi:MAG: nitrate ABC transporter, permease protein, partial [Aquabacterium sp.]|nr:nitrate ABC transporter, permease protein [Aquabacterium sp.]